MRRWPHSVHLALRTCVWCAVRSVCIVRAVRTLLVQAWQTQVCDPSAGPTNCAGMLRGVISYERRAPWFSELADITVAVAHAPRSAAALRPVAAGSHADFDNNAG